MEILYYTTASGNSPVKKFVEGLSQSLQEDFFLALDRLRQGESLGMPLSRRCSILLSVYTNCVSKNGAVSIEFSILSSAGMQFIWFMCSKKRPKTIPDKDRRLILRRLKEI